MRTLLFSLAILAMLAPDAAHALTTESGTTTPGTYLGVSDPDEKRPAALQPSEQQASSPPTGLHFTGGTYQRGMPMFNQDNLSGSAQRLQGPFDNPMGSR